MTQPKELTPAEVAEEFAKCSELPPFKGTMFGDKLRRAAELLRGMGSSPYIYLGLIENHNGMKFNALFKELEKAQSWVKSYAEAKETSILPLYAGKAVE